MNIGIYGGTFNPVHNAHVHILTEFAKEMKLDKIFVIPTKTPPHKEAHELASGVDRINMLHLALDNVSYNFDISDIEMKRQEKSYTSDTLLELRNIYPNDTFYLMMGEDMFMTVQNWVRSEIILKEAVICGSPRSDDGYNRMQEHAKELEDMYPYFRYVIKNISFIDISSTEIRESVKDFNKLCDFVPHKVAEYIRDHKLYI